MTANFEYPDSPGVDAELKRRIVEAIQGYDPALIEIALGHLLGATVAMTSETLHIAHNEIYEIAQIIVKEMDENWPAIVERRKRG